MSIGQVNEPLSITRAWRSFTHSILISSSILVLLVHLLLVDGTEGIHQSQMSEIVLQENSISLLKVRARDVCDGISIVTLFYFVINDAGGGFCLWWMFAVARDVLVQFGRASSAFEHNNEIRVLWLEKFSRSGGGAYIPGRTAESLFLDMV